MGSSAPIKLLIIDDSFSMRKVLSIMLNRCGLNDVDMAEGGRDALMKAQAKHYDGFFCDWNMPDVSGLEVIRALRKMPAYQSTPIMMITSERFRREVVSAVSEGADNYLVKPFKPDIFKRKLAEFLEARYPDFVRDLKASDPLPAEATAAT